MRTAATRVVRKYRDNIDDHPLDYYLPTSSTRVPGGVILYAFDPFRHRLRISTVRAVRGQVVVT